jgi:hypothetical protein
MRPVVTTIIIDAPVSNGIATAQSLASAGSLTLNGSKVTGGVAILGTASTGARRVIITSVGDDSTLTWTITGTDRNGQTQSEALTGATAGATVQSVLDYLTVTSITSSKLTAGNVTAGTNTVASGPWVPWDKYPSNFQVSLYYNPLTGTNVTAQVDVTYDDVYGTFLPSGVTNPRPFTLPTMTGVTTVAAGSITTPVSASRLTITAAAASAGTGQLTQTQQGN